MATLDEVIRTSSILVHSDKYALVEAHDVTDREDHFAVIRETHGVTVITNEARLAQLTYHAVEKWFRLFEIRISVTFGAPGFLARIAAALAAAGIVVLIVSSYGRDYLLLKDDDVAGGIEALKQLGFSFAGNSGEVG